MGRRQLVAFLVVACLLTCIAFTWAEEIPAFVKAYGQPAVGFVPGDRYWPPRISLDADYDHIYLAGASQVDVLDRDGTWSSFWPVSSAVRGLGAPPPRGEGMTNINDLAVAPWGEIYLVESVYRAVHRYSTSGEFLGGWALEDDQGWPLTVCADEDSVYVLTQLGEWGSQGRILRYTPGGELLAIWETPLPEPGTNPRSCQPLDIAPSAGGGVWLLNTTYEAGGDVVYGVDWRAHRYTPEGEEDTNWPVARDAWRIANQCASWDSDYLISILTRSSVQRYQADGTAADQFPVDGPWAMNLASDQFGYLFVLAQEPIPSDVDPYRDAIALRLEQVFPFGGLVVGDYFDMLARGTLAAPAAFAATPEGEVFARTGGLRADLTYVSHFPAEGGSPEALRTDRWPIYSPRTGEVEFASRKYAVADAEGDYCRLLAEPGDPTDGSGQWTITIGKYTSSEVLLGSVTIPGPLTPPGGWVEPGEPAAALGADGNLRIALAVYRSAQYSELEPFGVLWVGTVSTQGDLLHAWTDESFPPGAVSAIAVDPGGSVYVVGDAAWKYTASGERVGRIGGWGGAGDQRDAPGSLLRYANGVAMDEVGRLRVQDTDAGRLLEFAYTPAPFSDVPYWHWAKEAIRAVQEAGVAVGYADGRYAPEETVPRDQMAVYLARALAGSDAAIPAGPDQPRFRDVPTSHWAYRYIEYVAEQGIVDGYWDGSYRPALEVDRGQMAVFISRALAGSDEAVPPGPIAPSFSDVPTSHWAFRHVEYAKAQGVVGGYWDGTYRPDFAVTRDQMAVYVQRAFDLPQ